MWELITAHITGGIYYSLNKLQIVPRKQKRYRKRTKGTTH